jgi:hypothetical protein
MAEVDDKNAIGETATQRYWAEKGSEEKKQV